MNKRQSRYTLNVTSDIATVRVIEQRYIHDPDIHLHRCFLTPLSQCKQAFEMSINDSYGCVKGGVKGLCTSENQSVHI